MNLDFPIFSKALSAGKRSFNFRYRLLTLEMTLGKSIIYLIKGHFGKIPISDIHYWTNKIGRVGRWGGGGVQNLQINNSEIVFL